jgi:hypothetical protein
MAELNFFMARSDTGRFVELLAGRFGATLFLDGSDNPLPPAFRDKSSVEKLVAESRHAPRFFVVSELWQRYPLSVSEVNAKDGRHYFAIDQRYGGPAFDFLVSNNVREDNKEYIVPGWFSDYPWYIKDKSYLKDRTKYETFDRPDAMAEAFREVQRYLRKDAKRSVCRETGKVGPWILSGALAAYGDGAWLRQGVYHFEPRMEANHRFHGTASLTRRRP